MPFYKPLISPLAWTFFFLAINEIADTFLYGIMLCLSLPPSSVAAFDLQPHKSHGMVYCVYNQQLYTSGITPSSADNV